jgi:hypothetical protein
LTVLKATKIGGRCGQAPVNGYTVSQVFLFIATESPAETAQVRLALGPLSSFKFFVGWVGSEMPFNVLGSMLAAGLAAASSAPPNVIFICGESTDGRLLRAGSPIPLPNVELLKQAGVYFDNAYSNNPVCAPSRSSFWTGRATHKIPHMNNGFLVNGVWNNYEG